MNIRLATMNDAEAVRVLVEEELYLPKPGFYWHTPEAIERAIRARAYFVGVEGDDVVAITGLFPHGDSLWIDTIAVRQREQKRGLGRQLVDFAKRHAVEQGLSWLRVTTYQEYGVDDAYLAFGFRLVHRFPEYSEFEMPLFAEE